CCAAKDSEQVYRALKGEVAARGLAKLEARVCTSSCLDQCATGVTVLVEPDHFFYGRVTVADLPEIVDGLVTGQPVKRLVVSADQHEAKLRRCPRCSFTLITRTARVLAPATLAALPSARAIPDRDVFYLGNPFPQFLAS